MQMSCRILQERVSTFNEIAHISKDFHAIRDNFDCGYSELLLNSDGYYVADKSGDHIFIDKRLSGVKKLEVQFHETTHLVLHYPCDFLEFRQHLQAQVFSLIFLIPKKDILKYAQMKLVEIDYRLHPYLKTRWRIYEKYGI